MPSQSICTNNQLKQKHQYIEKLYIDHQPWLYKWLWKKLGCSFQAADLAQDTFVKVLKQKERETLREPRAYLQVLAQRSLFDFWRRKELEQAYCLLRAQQELNVVVSEETHILALEALNQLDKILYSLDPISRQVFVLSQLRQFTYQQISEQMGISVMTVRRNMKLAIMACAGLNSPS